jgi:hypothetical protein
MLTNLAKRLLTSERRQHYAWAAMFAAFPIVLSANVGLFDGPGRLGLAAGSIPITNATLSELCLRAEPPKSQILGYGVNWWSLLFLMPLALVIVRYVARVYFSAGLSDVEALDHPLVRRLGTPSTGAGAGGWVTTEQSRAALVRVLRAMSVDPRMWGFLVLLSLGITIYDVWDVLSFYANRFLSRPLTRCPDEMDWTVAFLDGRLDPWHNFAIVAVAYCAQLALILLASAVFVLLLRFNVTYLSRIYVHSKAKKNVDSWIVLDFHDDKVERCFGLATMRPLFNVQVVLLIVGGAAIMFSRYWNTKTDVMTAFWSTALKFDLKWLVNVTQAIIDLPLEVALRDPGQRMMAIAWMLAFGIVTLPALIKFLPFLRGSVQGRQSYLQELLPEPLSRDDVDAYATKFKGNSFWPAGDGAATFLFAFAIFVMFVVVVPLPVSSPRHLIFQCVALLAISFSATKLLFVAYENVLKWWGL